ncbi:glycosyltransferase family 2 protein, partial [Salinimicrobium sp. CDJ15-91]|nr:glycosyltransferase family 2 protein [Salinimicrobium oceani]
MPYASTLIIVPAYQEKGRIGAVVKKIKATGPWPVLVVDDGSNDATAEEAEKAGAKVVRHVINRGPGAATMTGLAKARQEGYTYAITIDGDDQ